MPNLTRAIVEQYVLYRQVQDREKNWDVNALTNGEKMVEKSILAVSFYVRDGSSSSGQYSSGLTVFFTGMVGAEMRNVSYFFHSETNVKQTCNIVWHFYSHNIKV